MIEYLFKDYNYLIDKHDFPDPAISNDSHLNLSLS